MKTTLKVFGMAVLVFGLSCFAQSQDEQNRATRSGKSQSVTGCLAKGSTDGEFTLTTTDGKTYNVRTNSDVNLAEHINHKVTITGTAVKGDRDGTSDITANKV